MKPGKLRSAALPIAARRSRPTCIHRAVGADFRVQITSPIAHGGKLTVYFDRPDAVLADAGAGSGRPPQPLAGAQLPPLLA